MIKNSYNTYTISSKEIKDAIRKHFIDKLGTNHNFTEKDIDLYMIDEKMTSVDLPKLTATLTINLTKNK